MRKLCTRRVTQRNEALDRLALRAPAWRLPARAYPTPPTPDEPNVRIFLAGIMQGSHHEAEIHPQTYRARLVDLLTKYWPEAEVYDPWADHTQSLGYDDARAREVFFTHNRMCREVDLLVAVVPEASMGTAIEAWEAFQAGGMVVFISPLAHNWTVRYAGHALYTTLDDFAEALAAGDIQRLFRDHAERRPSGPRKPRIGQVP